ncbi:hypothetical protein [Paenibacillus sp. UNC499MF]|uniref:hypothetical protein n=1 Tax=Paenibacillus sp. UNC499MF TaxID=1502751 RepID=UPI00089FD54E|nr:hypothetical protein [Paenibacillus sp. UNC499MF]SEF53892.1 hypothetical protein SAMN02799616_00407 [Paenibacillus sp. UNC499MF]
MKTAKLVIFFVLIYVPFAWTNKFDTHAQFQMLFLETKYDAAVNAAVQDGAAALTVNEKQKDEARYESMKKVRVNRKAAVDSFYKTLYSNFGVSEDAVGRQVLDSYLSALLIVGYDGCYSYTFETYTGEDGLARSRRLEGPKRPYTYRDATGEIIAFTLDEYVTVKSASGTGWTEGFRNEIGSQTQAAVLKPGGRFDEVRRGAIIDTIRSELENAIREHNVQSRGLGAAYTFTLPLLSGEEWSNTIDDVGMLAFVQGIPVGYRTYNNYALGGAKIVKRPVYYGYRQDNIPYFTGSGCPRSAEILETFASPKTAAAAGYYPKECNNGRK